jgi:hypothetical protein
MLMRNLWPAIASVLTLAVYWLATLSLRAVGFGGWPSTVAAAALGVAMIGAIFWFARRTAAQSQTGRGPEA